MRYQKGIPAILAAMVLAGCQASPLTQPAQLRAQTASTQAAGGRQVLRADAVVYQQPMPVEVEPNRLIFNAPQPDLRPNQVLMGRSIKEQDFLRRIKAIHADGKRIVADTVPATLFEAFSELDMAGATTVRAPEHISLRSQHFNIGGLVDIVVDLGVKPDFADAHLRVKDSRLFIRVAPRFDIDTQIRAEYTFLKVGGPQPVTNQEPPLQPVGDFSFTAMRVPAWLGPVPLVFHLNPGTSLKYGAYANGKLLASSQITGQFKASVEMEAALGETPTSKTDSDYQFDGKMLPPELKLTGIAKARLHLPTLHLDTEIAGLVGPFVEASPYIDGRYQKTVTVAPKQTTVYTSAVSSLGLAIDAGLTPTTLFGKQLARELRFKILDKQIKELYRKEGTDVVPN